MGYLFKFLEIDDEINYVLSGYFAKTVISFLEGDTTKLILEYFYGNPQNPENLIKHIYCKSISNLLSKFLNFSKLEDEKNNSLNLGDIGLGNTFNLKMDKENENKEGEEKEGDLDEFAKKLLKERISIYNSLINRLLLSTDLEVISNIVDVFHDFFDNSHDLSNFNLLFKGIFFNENTLETLYKCHLARGRKNRIKVIFFIFLIKIGCFGNKDIIFGYEAFL